MPSVSHSPLSELPNEVVKRICHALLACDPGSHSVPDPPALFSLAVTFHSVPKPRDPALVSLAVTCRSLSEVVLDVLWHTLASPWPLLYTLPQDLWTVLPVTVEGMFGHIVNHQAVRVVSLASDLGRGHY